MSMCNYFISLLNEAKFEIFNVYFLIFSHRFLSLSFEISIISSVIICVHNLVYNCDIIFESSSTWTLNVAVITEIISHSGKAYQTQY